MHPPANSSEQQLAQALRENEELKNALREIESQVAESKIATEEMEHLLYAVSHDLRTPLRTISSYTQLLERQFAFDADSREMTAFILKGVNEMKVLIEDLLKYSRVAKSPQRSPL
ncbi:MAG: hypothetical protein JO211_12125, partial [Acidobacteriaceae bacterium]|nr:hypothetical protein [Acidobacteriaceae bacterium]